MKLGFLGRFGLGNFGCGRLWLGYLDGVGYRSEGRVVLEEAGVGGRLSKGTLGWVLGWALERGLEMLVLVCLFEGFWVTEKWDLLSFWGWLWDVKGRFTRLYFDLGSKFGCFHRILRVHIFQFLRLSY